MKFVCRNKNCSRYGQEEEYYRSVFVMVDGKLQSVNAPCPECGEIREEINEAQDIPIDEKSINFGKYSSASTEEKQRILKERSHRHFEKEIKPFKEHQINEAIKNFNSVK